MISGLQRREKEPYKKTEEMLTKYIAPSAPLMTPEPEATAEDDEGGPPPFEEVEADGAPPPPEVGTSDEASDTPSIAESS